MPTPDAPSGPLRRSLSAVGAGVRWYLPSLGVVVALLLAWQLAVVAFGVKEFILPSPLAAFRAFARPNNQWIANFLATFYAVIGAFVLSAVLGIALAVVVTWNGWLQRAIMPVLVLFNTLPKIALAPLFVLWLGYGVWPNIVIGTTIAFFPMVVNTAVGLASAEPEILDLVRTLRASRWQVLRKIRFPNAVPYIFVGLKLNATMSVLGAIVGEFVGSRAGLGNLILQMNINLDTSGVFAVLVCLSAIGILLHTLMHWLQQRLLFWADQSRIPGV